MKKDRLYRCLYEAGNGCTGEFDFWSDCRAGSKGNKEDAVSKMKLKLNKTFEIIDIYLL